MISTRRLEPAAHAFREMLVDEAVRAARSAVSQSLRIAGVTVQLDIADQNVGAALLPALRHLATEDSAEPDAQLVVWSSPLAPFPWNASHLRRGGAVDGLCHGPVRTSAANDNSALMLWDAERRMACCWFADIDGVTRWDRAAPLRTALHFALAAPGRQLVHAACVGVDGRGVLLAGPGGSGKSTTTLACLRAGMQVVGDDYAAVELLGENARAWNLYSSIKVGERDGRPGGRDERRTLILGVDLPGAPTEALTLTAILIPHVAGGPESTLSEAGRADALRALAPSTLLQAPHEEQPRLGLMAELVSAVPAHHLHLGTDHGVPAIRSVVTA